jgi:hypothetical protein
LAGVTFDGDHQARGVNLFWGVGWGGGVAGGGGGGGGGSATSCASPRPWPSIFSDCSFQVHHPVNRDDHHFLAHATSQLYGSFSQRKQLFFVTDQTPHPYPTRSFPAQLLIPVHRMEYRGGNLTK